MLHLKHMHWKEWQIHEKAKAVPTFKTGAQERKFWETHASTDYLAWSKADRVRFPNLKPSTPAISIRLPLGLLEQIKIAATNATYGINR